MGFEEYKGTLGVKISLVEQTCRIYYKK